MSRFYGEDGFVPPKYWFYREFMQFMHKRGWHYAPREYPIDKPHETKGPGNTTVYHWRHWCEWCGLRGETIKIEVATMTTKSKELEAIE